MQVVQEPERSGLEELVVGGAERLPRRVSVDFEWLRDATMRFTSTAKIALKRLSLVAYVDELPHDGGGVRAGRREIVFGSCHAAPMAALLLYCYVKRLGEPLTLLDAAEAVARAMYGGVRPAFVSGVVVEMRDGVVESVSGTGRRVLKPDEGYVLWPGSGCHRVRFRQADGGMELVVRPTWSDPSGYPWLFRLERKTLKWISLKDIVRTGPFSVSVEVISAYAVSGLEAALYKVFSLLKNRIPVPSRAVGAELFLERGLSALRATDEERAHAVRVLRGVLGRYKVQLNPAYDAALAAALTVAQMRPRGERPTWGELAAAFGVSAEVAARRYERLLKRLERERRRTP